jgi:hypothetical protein
MTNGPSMNIHNELVTRHQATVKTSVSILIGVVLMCVLAYVSQKFLTYRPNPPLDVAVRITILVFGLGAIAVRRSRFAQMRLQDIGALQGASGLLVTLQRTTVLVALIGASIAFIGFAATLATGVATYTYLAGVVAVAVLLYGYPIRNAWQQAVRRFAPPPAND